MTTTFAESAKWLLIVVGVCAVLWVVLTQGLGWTPPAWLTRVLLIVAAVVVGVLAIRFLASL